MNSQKFYAVFDNVYMQFRFRKKYLVFIAISQHACIKHASFNSIIIMDCINTGIF